MQHRLHELTPIPLELIWHENKTTYLSVRKEQKRLFLRIHRLFYNAPTPVLEALIKYAMRKDKKSGVIIKQMAHLYFSSVTVPAKILNPKGTVYDLEKIFRSVSTCFEEKLTDITIGWSERVSKGKFLSITYGTFDKHCRQIRINPILDFQDVPLYFVEFVVYHEALHAICPSEMDISGRCIVHTKEFRRREKQFPHYVKAREWEKQSLSFFKKKRKQYGRS